ncbi:MAG: hypothetical protein GF334_10460 [Candidatus Altiarchaeales archaeon]|nr:hypothetical protein [Candidatus Altiarchaeales archaeon]
MKSTNWKGIKSKYALCFPEKGGRKFGNKIWDGGFRWSMEDLLEFLFPSHKMPVFHKLGVEYLKFLLEEGKNTENGKREFCRRKGYSMNTLRKNIIPKLYRFGLIHRSRKLPKNVKWNIKSKRQSVEQESLQFSTMMRKMADEWEAMVETARLRRQKETQKEREDIRDIEKQECLEWEWYLRGKGEY